MRLLLAASVILLAACDTTEIAQQQPEVNNGAIALYDERGNFVREYRDVQDCHAAAIRYNLRNVKENSESSNTYRRAGTIEPRVTSSCREV